MRLADANCRAPARAVARRAASARRQIHLAPLRPARGPCRRPVHDHQLCARRRLRVDARLPGGPGRYRLTNSRRRDATIRRSSPIHGRGLRGLRRPRRPPRLRQLRHHDADAGRRARRAPVHVDPGRRRLAPRRPMRRVIGAADARWAPARGRRRRPPAAHHPWRRLHRHHLSRPSAQRPGQDRRAARRAPGRRRHTASSSRPLRATTRSAPWRRSACAVDDSRPRRLGARRPAAARPRPARAGRPLVGGVLGRRRGRAARLRRHHRGRRPQPDAAPRCSTCCAGRRAASTSTVEDEWHGEPRGPRPRAARATCATLVHRAGRGPRADRRTARAGRARHVRRQRHGVAAPANCASRRATASPRWWPACAPWAPTPTSCPTASTSAARARSRAAPSTRDGDHRLAMAFAVAALGASGPTAIEGADAVAVSYPAFFEDLERLAREGRQDLPGGLHGRRQDDRGPRAGASGSTGGRRTSTTRSNSASGATSPTIFRQDGEPYFRRRRAAVLIEPAAERGVVVATGGGTFVDPPNRALMLKRRRRGLARCAVPTVARPRARWTAAGPWPPIALEMEQLYNQRLAAYRQAHSPRRRGTRLRRGAGRSDRRVVGTPDALPGHQRHPRQPRGLEAVLAAAAPLGYERVLVLGDLVGYGADPNAVVDRIRGAGAAGHHSRQPRQGRRRASRARRASTPWRAARSAGPTTR